MQPRGGAERQPAVLRLPVGVDTDVALQVIAGTGDPPALEPALVRSVRKRLAIALEPCLELRAAVSGGAGRRCG